MPSDLYIGVDMGGTRVKCGLIQAGRVAVSQIVSVPSEGGIAPALEQVLHVVPEMLAKLGARLEDCRGIGWGFPALIDHQRMRVRDAYGKYLDAPGWDPVQWSRQHLGLPAALENDARLALIGEWCSGAAQGSDNCAIVTLGTGIGTAVILDGSPLRGSHGAAGNLGGHQLAVFEGRPCSCGRRGCYESESGSKYLPELARETAGYHHSALAQEIRIDYEAVFRLAAAGDACAGAIRDRSCQLWGELCVGLVRCFDLDRILVGGGVMHSGALILPVLRATAGLDPKVEIVAAQHVDQMALMGVPWLVKESQRRSRHSE